MENTGSSLHSYQVEKFRLYFSNAKGDRLGSETVKVRYNSNTSREKVIVKNTERSGEGRKLSGDFSEYRSAQRVSERRNLLCEF